MRALPIKRNANSWSVFILAIGLLCQCAQAQSLETQSLDGTIRTVQSKVVKIYGAGGVHGLEAYQSGILISPDGLVLTALSYVLDTDELAVVLDDGRKWTAEFVGSDPIRELAVLKLPLQKSTSEADPLPYFDLNSAASADIGTRVLAVSNLFGIATGNEPASVLQGVVTTIAPLDARRGAYRTNFRREVYVVDAYANNPGAAGGALVDWQGRLLGVLGKELRSRVTGTWLNYALPAQEIKPAVDDILAGRADRSAELATAGPERPMTAAALGLVLVPNLLPRTPPYVDALRRDSSAQRAGLQVDDLIVLVNGNPTASCKVVLEEIGRHEFNEPVRISVLRDGELREFLLEIGNRKSESREQRVEPQADDLSSKKVNSRQSIADSPKQQALQAAVAAVEDAVVQIRTIGGLDQVDKVLLAQGPTTGLIVSTDGYIVSSAFNFAGQPTSILVRLPGDRQVPARIVAHDNSRLLVLLKVETEQPLPAAEAAPADSFRVGQWAIAMGRTFRADRAGVSVGIVSALDRMFGRVLQTDANISTANYGGPLIDIHGRVLGVLVPMSPQSGSSQPKSEVAGTEYYDSGIGFAVPLAHVLAMLDQWKAGEDLQPGLLGIGLARGAAYSTPAKITAVWPDSPAARAGWKPDDKIVSVDGLLISTQAQLRFQIVPRYAGQQVKITILRGDERIGTVVTLTGKLAIYRHAFLGILPKRPVRSAKGQDTVAEGITVRSVLPDSPAAAAGLQQGDRITQIGDTKVRSLDDALQLLDKHHPGEEVSVTLVRDHSDSEKDRKAQTFRVKLAKLPEDIPERDSLPSPANTETPFQLEPWKLPEFSQEAQVLRPKQLDASLAYGILIWLGEGEQELAEARAVDWKSLCQRDGLILVLPKPEESTGWSTSDLEYLRQLVRTSVGRLQVDPQRVVVAGRGKGGQLAYALALGLRQSVRAAVTIDAPLPRTIKIPENLPGQRLAVLSIESQNSIFNPLVEADVTRLQEAGYPVTRMALRDAGTTLNRRQRDAIARWIDGLDRL